MAGVTADAVIVEVQGKFAQYERDFDGLIKRTETGMAKLRRLTEKPVTVGGASGADREAATVERATTRKVNAARKEAESEAAKAARITAAVDRSIAAREREAQSAERNADRIVRAGSRAAAARQTAAMRAGTALGNGGSMPAPTSVTDKIDYLRRDTIDTQQRLNAAQAAGNRAEETALRDQLTQLRLINQYKRAGLNETEAAVRAEERIAQVQAGRARRAQPQQQNDRPITLGGIASNIRTAATIGFAGYGALQGAREYAELTDAYKQYNAQLKLATAESGNLAQAQEDVRRVATATRTGLSETADLYGAFQRNTKQLGITQTESARATETINKAFQISGATSAEASGGLRQFLQALQSGTLRGEEFNSVVENAPRLAKLLADQLTGGNIGALRALAEQGKITGDELVKSLTDRKYTEQIDAEFKQLPVTFDQAATLIRNGAVEVFGAFDQGGEFSNYLVNFATNGANNFANLAKSAELEGANIRAVFTGLGDVFNPLLANARSVFAGIRSEADTSRQSIANILNLYDKIKNLDNAFDNAYAKEANRNFGTRFNTNRNSDTAGQFLRKSGEASANSRVERAGRRLEALGFIVPRNKDGTVDQAAVNRGGIQRPSVNRAANFRPSSGPRVDPDVKKYQDQIADLEKLKASASGKELATINKQIARRQAIVNNLNQGVGVEAARAAASGVGGGRKGSSAETLAKRAEAERLRGVRRESAYNNEVESLNNALLSAKGRQAEGIEASAAAAVAEADAELKQREVKFQNQENEGRITEAQRQVLVGMARQIRAQEVLAANTEKAAALAGQALQRQEDAANNAGDAIRAELDVTKSRARRAQLEQQLLDKEYEARYARIADRIQKSTPGSAEEAAAEGELRNLPAQRAADDERNRQSNRSVYQRYRDDLTDTDKLSDEIDNIKVEVLDQVADSLAQATTNALGLTGALGNIVGQIIKIGIQRRLIGPLADSLFGKADGTSGGGLGSLLGSIFGGARASGGDVSAGRLYRINENGTEGFQPAMSGKIVPLGRMQASGGGQTIVIAPQHFDLSNAVMTPDLIRQMDARNRQYADAVSARAGQAAYNNSPGRTRKLQQLGS